MCSMAQSDFRSAVTDWGQLQKENRRDSESLRSTYDIDILHTPVFAENWPSKAGAMSSPTSALLVKSHWAELLIRGEKCWELRSSATAKRGRIALAVSGAQTLLGEIDLVDCVQVAEGGRSLLPLPLENFVELHKVPDLANTIRYKRTYAWVMRNPSRYPTPKPYCHKVGAVIWVSLSTEVQKPKGSDSANASKKRRTQSKWLCQPFQPFFHQRFLRDMWGQRLKRPLDFDLIVLIIAS